MMIAQRRIGEGYAKILGVSAVWTTKFPSLVKLATPTAFHPGDRDLRIRQCEPARGALRRATGQQGWAS
jgi:hypothetical protein